MVGTVLGHGVSAAASGDNGKTGVASSKIPQSQRFSARSK